MDHLSICRICLSFDTKLRTILDTHLQEIFELLTLVPLVKKDHRPVHACAECCSRLENCYQLRRSCLRSEELFTQLLSSQVQVRLTRVKLDPDMGAELQDTSQLTDSGELELEVTEEDTAAPPTDGDPLGECSRLTDFSPVMVNIETDDVTADVRHPEGETPVQDVGRILGPSPRAHLSTTQTVEQRSGQQKLTSANTNSAADDYNVNIAISANKISSIRSTNSSKGTKRFSCDTCQKRFTYKYQLKLHVRTHTGEKPYKCSHCMKCFSVNRDLTKHMRTHTGYKPYKCSDCMKCFSYKSYLIEHMRTHTGEKPYKCSDCMKCFSVNRDLTRHMHTHTGYKPYKCSDCMKCFSYKHYLIEHMRTHTGEKPYKCSDCMMCFTIKGNLIRHIRTHTGEKPYKCSHCLKCFSQSTELTQHTRTHTGEKPYQCSDCSKCFSRRGGLMRHIRTHIHTKTPRKTQVQSFNK